MITKQLTDWARRVRPERNDETAGLTNEPTGYEDNPLDPETLSNFAFCVIVKSWMDEDIIEATVRNAGVQGADAVYLLDNGSTDHTVRNAEAAGATLADIYRTDQFDGRLAQALMNAVVARESLRHGAEHVWWLYLDSDEFPEGPDGLSVREYLAALDRRFRIVGASFLNHLPDGKPEYLAGYHPIDFQPLCYEFVPVRQPPCPGGHWKHPLQRFDRSGHFILSNPGGHRAICSDHLVEPSRGIVAHHFQYRDEELTRAKLDLTFRSGSERTVLYASRGHGGFARRRRSLDAVYTGHWEEVDTVPNRDPDAVRHPRPWAHLADVRRWYSIEDIDEARARWAHAEPGRTPA